jgi:glycosyltransferase involved in cell wall biosynthesis
MPAEKKITTICMLSCMHNLKDDRIYWKESLTLKNAGYNVIHIGLGEKALDYISNEGIRLIQVANKYGLTRKITNKIAGMLLMPTSQERDIYIAAKKIQADVYHVHDYPLLKTALKLKKNDSQPKLVYDVHDLYGQHIRDQSRSILKPIGLFRAYLMEKHEISNSMKFDAVITTDEFIYNRFVNIREGLPITIIYNYSYFLPEKKEPAYSDKIYDVIYSGLVSKLRGIYEIVEAVQIIKQTLPTIQFLIIGPFESESLRQSVSKLIEKNNLGSNIHLHAAVEFEAIGRFYEKSKIGLCIFHPKKLYKTNVFIKTFEYMAFGLPIVSSNFGTVRHYVESTNTGTCVNPMEPVAISNAILTILNSKVLYSSYSTNGIQAIQEKYNWQNEATKFLQFYQKILSIS